MIDRRSPLEKMAARLAVTAPHLVRQFEDEAAALIRQAEAAFSDPVDVVGAIWRHQTRGPFVFSRPVHTFSDYEAFVFKLVMILAGLDLLGREEAEDLLAAVVYKSGATLVERTEQVPLAADLKGYNDLVEDGYGNTLPVPLDKLAGRVSYLIKAARKADLPSLDEWLLRHVGPDLANQPEASSTILTDEPRPFALPLGVAPESGRPLFYTGEASLLTIAPPGKGKTRCHIMPALASYAGPVIVLDLKGECYDETAELRASRFGSRIIRFSPTEPERSAAYNPLALVNDAPDEVWESARFLADLLVVIRSRSDAGWESQGKDLLTLIIAFVTKLNAPADRTMAKVLDLVATIGLETMLTMVSDPSTDFPAAMRRIAARFAQMAKNAPKQFEGVLSGASQHLQIWEGPKIERISSRSDWSPDDFRSPPYPSLYLCIPPGALDTYAPVLRVVIAQHVRRLMREHVRAEAPILFLLDELPRLGQMDPIREALEVGRSYGIKLWMIAQYPEQLVNAYPGVGEGMMESCDVRMFMNPTSAGADRIAKAFGTSKSVLGRERLSKLEAIDILGPQHRDSIFVLASNETPRVVRKRFYSGEKA